MCLLHFTPSFSTEYLAVKPAQTSTGAIPAYCFSANSKITVSLETGDTVLCQLLLQDRFGGGPQVAGGLPVAQN